MRIFIALNLPEELRDYVLKGQETLAAADFSVKWVERKNLHLTLEFLGEIEAFRLPRVEKAVSQAAKEEKPFSLFLQGAGVFPNLKRPRVLWGDIKGEVINLKNLQRKIHLNLMEEGLDLEKREFAPHLTIGRVRHPKPLPHSESQKLQQLLADTFTEPSPFWQVNKVDIMQSILRREGPEYIVQQTFFLGPTE